MSELKIINEQEVLGKQFKIYGDFENPLFLAKDVAEWIGHSNASKMVQTVDDDEKTTYQLSTLTNSYSALFLTEDGLYEVLMQSRKPIAKAFKKEVKNILKSIRKHGAYMTNDVLEMSLQDPDYVINLLQNLKEEKVKANKLKEKIEIDKPKVEFAEAVASSNTTILIGDLAKLINQNGVDIGSKRLFGWLRDNGYLIKRKGLDWNSPTQYAMERGLFRIKESIVMHGDEKVIHKTSLVTGKGQRYFVKKFVKNKEPEQCLLSTFED